jgi:hypothetical protein
VHSSGQSGGSLQARVARMMTVNAASTRRILSSISVTRLRRGRACGGTERHRETRESVMDRPITHRPVDSLS